jgi:putative copper resistance protein D
VIPGLLARWSQLVIVVALVGTATAVLLAGPSDRRTAREWEARMLAWIRVLAGLALVSGVFALAWQAAHLSGRPAAAIEWTSLRRVLLDTRAGHVWLVRQGLLLLLAAFTAVRLTTETTLDWRAARAQVAALAAATLMLVAASSHAAAVKPDAVGAMLNDAVHLLAAGIWLGALIPLGALLRACARDAGADARPYAVLAARRFSRLALASVVLLVMTGIWNTTLHVGGVAALVGTVYGRLLVLELLLVAAVLGLAVVNRRRLLPALSGEGDTVGRPAMRRLAGLVTVEAILGLGLIAVVAALTTTPPARHETPIWPFPLRLSLGGLPSVSALGLRALVGSQLAVLGLVALGAAFVVVRRRLLVLGGSAALLVTGLVLLVPPLLVEAYPTTYARPSVPYTAASLARGGALYREHCGRCHTLAGARHWSARLARHTAGDLYWWITHGVPTAGMPAIGRSLSDEARWDLVNFLRAMSAAEAASAMGPSVDSGRPWLVAPDFTFGVGPMPPRTLRDYRGRRLVLLALYSLPTSRPRLEQLAQQYELLGVLGAEVIAVPRDADPQAIRRLGAEPRILFPIVTEGAEDILTAYQLFGSGRHVEFLIDRQGFIRARWIAGSETRRDMNLLIAEIQQLNEEQPSGADADEHVH